MITFYPSLSATISVSFKKHNFGTKKTEEDWYQSITRYN